MQKSVRREFWADGMTGANLFGKTKFVKFENQKRGSEWSGAKKYIMK